MAFLPNLRLTWHSRFLWKSYPNKNHFVTKDFIYCLVGEGNYKHLKLFRALVISVAFDGRSWKILNFVFFNWHAIFLDISDTTNDNSIYTYWPVLYLWFLHVTPSRYWGPVRDEMNDYTANFTATTYSNFVDRKSNCLSGLFYMTTMRFPGTPRNLGQSEVDDVLMWRKDYISTLTYSPFWYYII